jgi:N-acetylglucosaminyldiphosphoundecaprenol N-acetyl-beta-D-mannosaminyltransferase
MSSDVTNVAVVLGAPVDDVTVREAVDRIAEMVADGRATGRVHQVVTVNADFVVNAQGDPDLLAIMQRSDLAIPDGMPLVWGSKLLGTPLRERATGVELLPALVERAARDGHRICLFGAAPGIAARAADLLGARHPGATVVGLEAPVVGRDGSMDPTGLEPLRAVDADIVGVALGNPKQEHWISRHGTTLGCPVFIGIGGTLDFLTGQTRRAPQWMQRAGLEWLHRALSEPRRLAMRYAKDIAVFIPGLLGQAWHGRGGVNAEVASAAGAVRDARRRGDGVEGFDAAIIESARRLGAGGIFTS